MDYIPVAFEHNLYWHEESGEMKFGDMSWKEWREIGFANPTGAIWTKNFFGNATK